MQEIIIASVFLNSSGYVLQRFCLGLNQKCFPPPIKKTVVERLLFPYLLLPQHNTPPPVSFFMSSSFTFLLLSYGFQE